jgi:integrase
MSWTALYHFQEQTGCRVGEALALTWECVEIKHGTLWDVHTADGIRRNPIHNAVLGAIVRIEPHKLPDGREWRPKRPASQRAMVVALSALGAAQELSGPQGLVFFPGRDRAPSRQAAWKALKKLRGPDARSHDLRRAFITRKLSEGVDPWTLARYVGHRSLRSMLPYLISVSAPVSLSAGPAGGVPPAAHWAAALQSANWRKR